MTTILLRLLPILISVFVQVRAADESMHAALLAADDERVAATLSGDRAKLTAVFSDDLHYAHSSGVVDTKASYIDAIETGRLKYIAWKYQERKFTFPAPGVALMTGRTRVKVGKADGPVEMLLGFLAVWREEKGRWRFVAWQSGKIPEPAVTTK